MKTATFLSDELRRLAAAGIRSFIIRGNHDALSRVTKELVLPDLVKLFGGRAEHVLIERAPGEKPVAIHGLSFANPTAPESLLPRYGRAIPDAINIGILHTSLGGAPGHDPYAPCSPADLHATGFDYWALGHIHKRSVATPSGAAGRNIVVMPGMPQGRDINEDGAKSVTLVAISDDGTVSLEERQTALAEFARVTIDAGGLSDWSELAQSITHALTQARAGSAAPELVVRLGFSGATDLAWRMRRDADLLMTEAHDRASRIGAVWVEKIDVGCVPPKAEGPASSDPLHELHALMHTDILGSQGYGTALAAMAENLQGQLPPELRDLLGTDEIRTAQTLENLAREGAEDVLARLQGGPATGPASETA